MTAMPAIGLASGVVPELSAPDTVAAAAAGGFDSVGLWVEPPLWTAETTRSVRSRVADAGLSVIDVEVIWIKPGPPDPDHLRILDIGGEVGAAHALAVSSDTDVGATTAKFAALCEHAASIGIAVAFEFGPFSEYKTMGDVASVLRAVDHPSMRLLPDTIHLDRSGGTAAQLADIPRAWLSYAQLCDAPAERPDLADAEAIFDDAVYKRALLGEGALDVDGFLEALPAGLPLSLEMRSQKLYDAYPDGGERAKALATSTRRYFAARAARLASTAATTGAGSK
jgi:sugar phosphate isomerase/epimerase